MSLPQPAPEYFVVGGPVTPERPCYVARAADRHLLQALREGRSCHVLGARQTGKTSLMLHTARQLAEGGRRAVMLDLAQVGAREHRGDPGRWFYSFAYRILRELRIKTPLQAWWQERVALTVSQRLQEFFRDLVLGELRHQVVIFIDDLECAETLPFAGELLASLRACLNARATDPDFARLSFVLLGVTTPRRLSPEPSLGPFAVSEAIVLEDFTLGETLQLAPGLGLGEREARAVLERVHYWTGGHPYFTQKICRGVSRDDLVASPVAVDRFVEQRLLAPAAAHSEPLLAHVVQRLRTSARGRARVLGVYGRVRKGTRVVADPGSPAQERLLLLGLVREDGEGRLVVRNRICAGVFTARWVNQNLPMDWRGLGAAAAIGLALVALPVWYTQYLPRDQIAVLSAADVDEQTLLDAYRRLRRLPGHANTADRLLAGVLERRSRRSDDLREVRALHEILAALPGQSGQADALLADFWRRRLEGAQDGARRDEALLAALEVAALDPGDTIALARLAATDYRHLVATLRWPEGIHAWQLNTRGVVVADGEHRVHALDAEGDALAPPLAVHALAWRDPDIGPEALPAQPIPGATPTRDIDVLLADGDGDIVAAVPDASTGRGAVVLWSRAQRAQVGRVLRPERLYRSGLALEGRRLLLAAEGGLWIHATDGGAELAHLPWTADTAGELVLSADGRHVAVISPEDGRTRVRVIELESADTVHEWTTAGAIAAAALTRDGTLLAVADHDRVVRTLDARDGRLIAETRSEHGVQQLVADPLGDWLLVHPRRGVATWYRLPELGEARQRYRAAGPGEWLQEPVSMNAAGAMAVVREGGAVQVLRLADGAALTVPLRHGARAAAPTLSADGTRIATWDGDALRLWRTRVGEARATRIAALSAASLGPDGRDALLGLWDGRVIVLPAAELAQFGPPQTQVLDYLGHTAPIRALVMNDARDRLASASTDGVIRTWDTLTMKPAPSFMRHAEGEPEGLAFSPDGRRLVSWGGGGLRLWDAARGTLERRFEPVATPLAATFSADGAWLAVGDAAANILLWSLDGSDASDAPPLRLRADAAVTALSFAARGDGAVLLSGDRAGRVQAWRLDDGQRFGPPVPVHGPVLALIAEGDLGMWAAVTSDWHHRFALSTDGPRHRGARFLPRTPAAASVRAEDGGRELVALGPPDVPALIRFSAPPETDIDALAVRDWTRVLGIVFDESGHPLAPGPRAAAEED